MAGRFALNRVKPGRSVTRHGEVSVGNNLQTKKLSVDWGGTRLPMLLKQLGLYVFF